MKIKVFMRVIYGIHIYVLVVVLQGSCFGRNLCCSGVDSASALGATNGTLKLITCTTNLLELQ